MLPQSRGKCPFLKHRGDRTHTKVTLGIAGNVWCAPPEIAPADDERNMTDHRRTAKHTEISRQYEPTDWNLMMVATTPANPAGVLGGLSGAITACGGWVLTRGVVSEHCADIDFEFPRTHAVEIYALLVGSGVELSLEAHQGLTELCQCTRYVGEAERQSSARIHLSLYEAAGGEAFLGSSGEGMREAA